MSEWSDQRPMAPHLQVWRWHVTMLTSILHRATGIAMYAGMALITAWLVALASGAETYEVVEGLLLSLVGRLVLFGFTLAVMFHLANGLRYLFWDIGKGFEPKTADFTGVLVILFAIAGTLGVWAAAYYL